MRQYVLSRLILLVVTLWGVSAVVFLLVFVGGGDPVQTICGQQCTPETLTVIRAQYGFNRPIWVQYGDWAGHVLRLDFGRSLYTREPVGTQLRDKFPVTFEMGVLALLVGIGIAVPAGMLGATRQNSAIDHALRGVASALSAFPHFWLGLLAIGVGTQLGIWTPTVRYAEFWKDPGSNLAMLLPPSILLGVSLGGVMLRVLRSEVLEVWRQNYVRVAMSKGLSERIVVRRHALRNAMLPAVTLVGAQVPLVIGGAVIMEAVFGVPGIGRYLLDAFSHSDLPVVQGIVLCFAAVVLLVNLVVDLSYPFIDPRVRAA